MRVIPLALVAAVALGGAATYFFGGGLASCAPGWAVGTWATASRIESHLQNGREVEPTLARRIVGEAGFRPGPAWRISARDSGVELEIQVGRAFVPVQLTEQGCDGGALVVTRADPNFIDSPATVRYAFAPVDARGDLLAGEYRLETTTPEGLQVVMTGAVRLNSVRPLGAPAAPPQWTPSPSPAPRAPPQGAAGAAQARDPAAYARFEARIRQQMRNNERAKADCERSKAAHERLDPSDPYPAPKIFGPDCSAFDRLNAELQRLLTR